eukprot:TRINITY_DN1886_c0_g1_i1.p2 TRINITY_DN1886_c0_g1~~TRINITY_DN1886_c0_g1_i1.p2  ORF type:complete len:105 (-),score=44.00 TRINITY_DN1886_c0_g1_i1:318-632(-)
MCIRDRPYSAEQKKAKLVEVFSLIDTNSDGFLDKSELVNAFKSDIHAQACIDDCDSNADGKVSLEEWITALLRAQSEEGEISDEEFDQKVEVFKMMVTGALNTE